MDQNIPRQFEGRSFDCYNSVTLASKEQAGLFYERVKAHLLDVNHWHEIAELPSAVFKVKDATGRTVHRPVKEGDHVRIDIPGPGLPSAGGYDWVKVVAVRETLNNEGVSIVLTLRPAPDPTQDLPDTAHFFTQIATSSIMVEQVDRYIYLHYAGRNEVINTDNASMMDNLRNFMVGIGAKLGASFPQWKALIEGLGNIERPVEDE